MSKKNDTMQSNYLAKYETNHKYLIHISLHSFFFLLLWLPKQKFSRYELLFFIYIYIFIYFNV